MQISRAVLCAASTFAIVMAGASQAHAETPEETAARFGLRQNVLDISLSPSGNRIAYVSAGPRGSEVLNVIDLAGDATVKPIMQNTEQNTDIDNCDWASEDRLVCNASFVQNDAGVLVGFSRSFAVSVDGKDVIVLSPRDSSRALGIRQDGGSVIALDMPGQDNRVLMSKQYVPEKSSGTNMASSEEGLGVEWVDVVTGKRGRVEGADLEAIRYVADENGRVRIKARRPAKAGVMGDKTLYFYRDLQSDEWKRLSSVSDSADAKSSGIVPVAVDSAANVAYGFDTADGFDVVVKIPLVEGGAPQTLVARNDVDVDGLIRVGRQRRVVGATYATKRRQVEYFDPELKKLAASLHNALPGKPLINFVGASADEKKLLMIASSDTDPGMVYLYDKATRQLNEVVPVRGYLSDVAMAPMKPITFPAPDGVQIPGYLTLPPGSDGKGLPAIVMPHGGPGARDEWGFDWLVQYFAQRGYAVLQPNFRGSTGYGESWYGRNGFQAWKTAIGDVNEAGRWLVSQGIAKPEALAIMGWSYGGYAALQSQVLDPALFKAVVAIAPVADLERLRNDARPYTNSAIVDRFIGRGEHVVAGSPAQNADRFAAPVLVFHGTADQNVDVGHGRMITAKLKAAGKQVEYVEFDGLDHGLSDSFVRTEMLKKAVTFLTASLKR